MGWEFQAIFGIFLIVGTPVWSRDLLDIALFSNSGVTQPVRPSPEHVQGIIQAGFTKSQAIRALTAVKTNKCCQEQIDYLFKERAASKSETLSVRRSELQCNIWENSDYGAHR
ncbi:hypothetical protein CYMTET_39070 [Cymbomonas tetramitiformis]|uniref:UBA domain-containing protein n=1 Tax=Cymbomonas tetramitiformis TaxID=36881 RepID=A0AAE0CCU8_9CHLO|nr:hypothetical protein CYMTET_39070 [Cymbomonas tetramitiformis]